ncbi:hypothetical protein D2962_04315 [Biomaibacter acetigenes]|jgi:spore maturation protein CgeB|uniref:Spore protein YkvP/CgeB glycosyl transferase-like domain-containing protein n=2 Tax=Biomaibacter acetigenes TaxID=2316383 RepID=A0A3G2R3L0_9FIRM|nr:hypothetical protein D2962_04315 [Biomaibacter acetigenes]
MELGEQMKIIYISSGFPWPHNNIDYSIINGFLKLGQEIIAVDVKEVYNKEFYNVLNQFHPDFILTLHGLNLDINKVIEIKNMGYKIGVWLVDDPYEIDNSIKYAINYDYIFNTERSVIDLYKKYVINSYYLPLGSNEDVFNKTHDSRYYSDICIIGSAFQSRLDIIDELYDIIVQYNVKIIGQWWEKLKCYDMIKNKVLSQIITDEEAARYYSNSKINLNIHRSFDDRTFDLNKSNLKAISPNNRTFDISAAGGFQIVDYREDLERFYKIGEEVVVYDGIDDLINKIQYYLKHDDERTKIAEKAYQRTLKEHLFTNRLGKMLEIVSKKS